MFTKLNDDSGSPSFEELPRKNSRCDKNVEETINQNCSNTNEFSENVCNNCLEEWMSINEGSVMSTIVSEQIARQDSLIARWDMFTHLDDENSVFTESNIEDHMSSSASFEFPDAIVLDVHQTALQTNNNKVVEENGEESNGATLDKKVRLIV